MLKKLTAIVLIALLSVFCCVACAPEPVPPDMAQNLALPEPVPPDTAQNTVAPESTLVTETVPTDRVGARVALYDTSLLFWRREQAPALRCYSLIALPEPVPPATAQNLASPEPVPPDNARNTAAPEPVPPDTSQNLALPELVPPDREQNTLVPEPVPPDTAQNTAAPEPVPPDNAQNLALPEPVPPESAPIESTPVPRAESFTTRPEKTRNAEIGCSFAFFLLAVSAFSMMGALSVCNQPGDDF